LFIVVVASYHVMLRIVHSDDCAVTRYLYVHLCPSVCLSVTRWYCVETVKHILKLFSTSGSHIIRLFHTKRYGNEGTP